MAQTRLIVVVDCLVCFGVLGAAVPRLSVGGVDAGFTASIYSSLGKNDVKGKDCSISTKD